MRSNKHIIIITLCTTVLSLVGILITYGQNCSLIYDLSLACFGSAILGLIMTIPSYFSVRRESMERFWQESLRTVIMLKKIPFFDYDDEFELVVKSISEDNVFLIKDEEKEYNRRLYDKIESQFEAMSFYDDDETLRKDCIDRIKSMKHNAKNQINSLVDYYLKEIKIEHGDLDNAFGSLDFFRNDECRGKLAYTGVYKELLSILRFILDKKRHLIEYKNSVDKGHSGNIIACYGSLKELNDYLFEIKIENKLAGAWGEAEEETEVAQEVIVSKETQLNLKSQKKKNYYSDYKARNVYQTKLDDIEDNLEIFRSKIYHNEKPISKNRLPIISTFTFEENNSEG